MPASSESQSLGMPGGSWTIEKDDHPPQSCSVNEPAITPHKSSPNPIQEPCTAPSDAEIVLLDPASLSEEFRLPASPTSSASRETWRVRISPEYDIEVLPPEEDQDRTEAMPRHIRDSPEQRRSRCLDNIFPDIKDLHSSPRSATDTHPVPPILDLQWDFAQYDHLSSVPDAGTTGGGDDVSLSTPDGLQDHEVVPALGLGLGLNFASSSTVNDLIHEGTESTSSNSPLPASPEDSSLDDDLSTTHSSPSPPVTSISIPSTVHPSPSSPRSNVPYPSSGFGDSDDEPDSPYFQHDQLMQTPSSPVNPAVVADQADSESMLSVFIRPATASVVSADEEDKSEAEEDGLTDTELEYLDECPTMTPLSLFGVEEISLPLSLDSSFGFPDGWEVIPNLSSTPDSFFGETDTVVRPSNAGSASNGDDCVTAAQASLEALQLDAEEQTVSDPVEEPTQASPPSSAAPIEDTAALPIIEPPEAAIVSNGGMDDLLVAAQAPLGSQLYAEERSSEAVAESHSESALEDEMVVPLDDESGHLTEPPEPSESVDEQSDESWSQTLELPALHFHSPSLTEEVLSSPEFHVLNFCQDFESGPGRDPASTPSHTRHIRMLSVPNVERRSILWAPHDTRYVPEGAASLRRADPKGKGKDRVRRRTISTDSGFVESEGRRIEREVQTETEADRLKKRVVHLEKQVGRERAKVARLRRDNESSERWESSWMVGALNFLGLPYKSEDDNVL